MKKSSGLPLGALICLAAMAGCAPKEATTIAAAQQSLVLSVPRVLSGAHAAIVTSMAALAPSGLHVYAWVELPAGGETPRLFVATDRSSARTLPDADSLPGIDPETPPKIGFGAHGEIYLAYQATKASEPHQGWTAIHVFRSTDDGQSWSPPTNTADNGAWGEYRSDHAFHVARDGSLYAAWLDNRDPQRTRVLFARSTDSGRSWSHNTAVDPDAACDCCRMAIASSGDGRIYVAWRKVLPGSRRDIVVASSSDGGAHWSKAVRAYADDWQVDGCPDAGPALLADDDGRLHLAWWTGKAGAAGVKFVSSPDGGASWGAPVVLRVAQASTASHVQLARAANGTIYAAWDDGTIKVPKIVLAASSDNGASFGTPIDISAVGATASHPVIAAQGTMLVLAWNQANPAAVGGAQVLTRTASLP